MDDDLRRLERAMNAGDEEAGARWAAERRRRGLCELPKCEVGIQVLMDRPGLAELWWGGTWRPRWTWSVDRVEDDRSYPKELAILLNSVMPPYSESPGFNPVRFVFRPTPFGVLAYGACHACEKPVLEPQDIVIDDGPRWGSIVPLWLRRSKAFKGAVAQTGEQGPDTPHTMRLRTVVDIPTPWELVPLGPFPTWSLGRFRPQERPRMRFELQWEPWRCECGGVTGRALVVGDRPSAAPFVRCPACGATASIDDRGDVRSVLRPAPPTTPRAPSPRARSGS